MRELCEGLIKAMLFISIPMAIGFGFGIGLIAAYKLGGPFHIEMKTTVRHAE
jgi:hypothetical protein